MRRGVILLAALIFMLVAFWASTWAQSEQPGSDEEYISSTGHTLTGKFYERYHQVENPVLLYGFPITDQFTNKDGIVVQYFSRARFEQEKSGEVLLTPIGAELLAEQGLPGAEAKNPPGAYACKEFPDTGFQVCLHFLEFYEQNGGFAQFGNPISNQIYTGTQWVQYFDNAVLEFKFDSRRGLVSIADVGLDYFELLGENPRHRLPTMKEFVADDVLNDVLNLEVNAFIHRDPAADDYKPTLYVIVQDQRQFSLENASLEFLVQYADGKEESFLMPPTNEYGFSKMGFEVSESQPGIVELAVKATYNNLVGSTKASFRIWY